jgi:trehalose synthase-fused probable maltokinase
MDSTLACLAGWMAHQRWYSSKASSPRLRLLSARELPSGDATARVVVYIVVDESVAPAVVYQIPSVERSSASVVDEAHVIGIVDGRVLMDGPHDHAYTATLLRTVSPDSPPAESQVLSGEQSNTSVIFRPRSGPPLICKVFRQLNPGLNPDIELQSALAQAGSAHVPRAVGSAESEWVDPDSPGRTVTGSLAFAQEFLPDVEDAWRVARRAALKAEPFTSSAHALGAATADVHQSLAQLFPTSPGDDRARSAIAETWRRRLSIAASEVPTLSRHREAIAAVYARALDTAWPPLQRIHGDYHLGQVLQAPGRGWVLLDFEGEPMRPMAERRRPDSALRDVAGMLRSFDYVAGSLQQDDTQTPVTEWAAAARSAFLEGYEQRMGSTATGPLLDAFELDKAVYEAIYEARNRPDWVAIPLAAIERLVSAETPGVRRVQ